MRDGPREFDDRLAGAVALPPQEVARRRRAKVKVEEAATERGGEGEMTVKVKVEEGAGPGEDVLPVVAQNRPRNHKFPCLRIVYKIRGCAHGVRGQEGAPRRGGGPLGLGLHHFQGVDGTGLVVGYSFGG